MSYIGRQNLGGAYRQLDDISSGFDGSDTTHTMQVNSQNVTVGDVNQIILSLGGVIQKPGTDFTVSGSVLTFTTAPAANTSFFAVLLGSDNGGTTTPTDGSVTTSKIVDDAVTAAKVASSGAFAIGAAGTASSIAGLPIYVDSSSNSVYTHDVSGTDNSADNNTAFGLNAADAITTADSVTVFGRSAGSAITTGSSSTFFGKEAGLAVTEGTNNIFMGVNAGHDVTTGGSNIAIGATAYDGCDTESHNLAIGRDALGGSVAGGEYNVAIGNYAGDAITSSDHNVILGYQAGTDMTGGGSIEGQNTLLGNYAGGQITNGYQNICLGYQSANAAGDGVGADLTTGYRNILIGPYSNMNNATHSHAIVMGYAIDGVGDRFTFGKPSNIVYNSFTVDNSWTQSSDVRKKKNIKDAVLGLDFINDLRTVTFEWKPNHEFPEDFAEYNAEENYMTLGVTMHGMIAQEVKEALDKTGVDRFGGWQEDENGSQYLSKEMFIYPLIKAVQELSAKVKALEEA